jgi:hypothetical protein
MTFAHAAESLRRYPDSDFRFKEPLGASDDVTEEGCGGTVRDSGRFVLCSLRAVVRCVGRFHRRGFAESAFCVEVSDRRLQRSQLEAQSGPSRMPKRLPGRRAAYMHFPRTQE